MFNNKLEFGYNFNVKCKKKKIISRSNNYD